MTSLPGPALDLVKISHRATERKENREIIL